MAFQAKTAAARMTTANKVTIFRILLVPAFIVQLLYYFESRVQGGAGVEVGTERDRFVALLLFAIAAILDGVDGYIARRYNQKSELGSLLDPLADKLLLVAGIVLLSIYPQNLMPRIPTWFTAIVLSRDIILLLGLGIIYYTYGKLKVAPRLIGKVATILQMFLVVWAMLKWDKEVLWYTCLGTGIITALSGVIYVRDGVKWLSQSPLSSPDHRL
jgi:CDP-diacylglycerol--glycerol-3-phosphate 3-phosphatidyltransferase